jgi:hypothetical protein
METVEKQTAVFPPFPQPLLLLKMNTKTLIKKERTIVYTKSLTLPFQSTNKTVEARRKIAKIASTICFSVLLISYIICPESSLPSPIS